MIKLKILEQVSSSEKLTNFCNFMSRGGKSLKIDIIKKNLQLSVSSRGRDGLVFTFHAGGPGSIPGVVMD